MTENLCQAVVIGASAGAIEALSTLLPALPSGYRLPVLIVVHVPPDRKSLLPDLFRDKCAIKVVEADDKEPVQNGVIYFAPPDYHLLVETGKTLSLSSDEPVLFSRPSVDVLFESAADAYGAALTAVILSGASQDGAKGLLRRFRSTCKLLGSHDVRHESGSFSAGRRP
jgi:two-component system chemotaxis response regulator CheB